MSEAVTPDQYAEFFRTESKRRFEEFLSDGFSRAEALAFTLLLQDKLHPPAVAPISPDMVQFYERLGTSLAKMADVT